MANSVVKIYGDGEFWVDGERKAKLYPDGDIWANGKKIGKVYSDGDIWIDGKSVGRVFSNGDLWIGSRKVATGIYLLDLLDQRGDPPVQKQESHTTFVGGFVPKGRPNFNSSSSGCSGFGCMALFVVVLLIVALVYACFALWFSELPQILFGNLQYFGTGAMVSVYACMFLMIYKHCKLAVGDGRVQFFKGLLMQGGTFVLNIFVFTVLDVLVTASDYGIPVGDALGELGGLLGGFGGMVASAFFVALAPTAVSSIISAICIKKGVDIPNLSLPKMKFPTKSAVKKSYGTSKKFSFDGMTIICVLLTLLAVYLNAALPFAAILSMDALSYMPLDEIIWVPTFAFILAVVIRREKCQYSGFWAHWLWQSGLMLLGNCINVHVAGFSDPSGGFIISTAIVTCLVGFLATFVTSVFMKR